MVSDRLIFRRRCPYNQNNYRVQIAATSFKRVICLETPALRVGLNLQHPSSGRLMPRTYHGAPERSMRT